MKELSLNILDIAENSVKAKATLTEILVDEDETTLTITIRDNGTGMEEDFLRRVTDPFTTTRTTRKVGMGIPLLKMEAEMTGGSFSISSVSEKADPEHHGTETIASFQKNHLDFIPLGDVSSSVVTLIQGHPDTDFAFRHTTENGTVDLDTREIREALGDEVPLNEYEVIKWIEDSLKEQYEDLQHNKRKLQGGATNEIIGGTSGH